MGADAAAEEPFGPYLVYERLGVGGMATVHRALEHGGRTVALKRLLPHLAEDASFIKSFVREAKLASFLQHVNIVQIYELGRVGTEYFISMEYIDGRDIRRILRHARRVTGPPPLHVTVGLLLQLCDALDYAHHMIDDEGHPLGLVHRDVSPSNVLVTSSGHVKVIDFGIAKAQSSQLRTQTGRVKGKLAYMAPEAIAGREADARSDVFACGVIAHELLTARPLFASKNEYQTLMKVQRGDILPPSTFNEACPPDMDDLVLHALARDPDERYPGAAAMRADLMALAEARELATSPEDVALWVDWAFDLDVPVAFASAATPVRATPVPTAAHRPSTSPRSEDEDAVEIAWGGGAEDGGDAAGPIVLDDIPDVSDKHLAITVASAVAGGFDATAVDDGHHVDDLPPVEPSHGVEPRRNSRSFAIGRAQGGTTPPPRAATDDPGATGRLARVREPMPYDTLPGGSPADDGSLDATFDPTFDPTLDPMLDPTHDPTLDASLDTRHDDSRAAAPWAGPADPTITGATLQRTGGAARPTPTPTGTLPLTAAGARHAYQADLAQVPATKRGHAPPRIRPVSARTVTEARPLDDSERIVADHGFPAAGAPAQIGASLVERDRVRPRRWVPLALGAALLLAGGSAVGRFVLWDRAVVAPDLQALARLAPETPDPGTIKLVLEPPDAEVRIGSAAPHAGSPWQLQLAPGAYPIEIHKSGYKSWLTTIELSARETQTLRVVLEPLGAAGPPGVRAAASNATLVLTTSPPGLEAVIDGVPLAAATPIRLPIRAGAHVVSVRRGGVEVWRQAISAQPDAVYEYAPSFSAEKERERLARPAPETSPAPSLAPVPVPIPAPSAPAPSAPPPMVAPPPPPPPIASPTPAPVPAPAPAPVHAPVAVLTVAPNAVHRLAGDAVSFTAARGVELPAIVSAKLCIDASGQVTSADIVGTVDKRAGSDIVAALRTWTYAPYRHAGTPQPVCFVVSMRTR